MFPLEINIFEMIAQNEIYLHKEKHITSQPYFFLVLALCGHKVYSHSVN